MFDIILSDEEEAIIGESSLKRNRSRRCLRTPSADDDDGAAPLDRMSAPSDSRNVCVSPRLPESSLLLWIDAPPPQPDSPWLLLRTGRDAVLMLMLMRRLGPGNEDKSSDSESRPESFISCAWVRAALDSAPTSELRDILCE